MLVIGPRIVVKRMENPAPKSSLIEVVSLSEEKSPYALVLVVGSRVYRDGTKHPIEGINVGDVVLLKTICGADMTMTINGEKEEVTMVMEDDVLATVEL